MHLASRDPTSAVWVRPVNNFCSDAKVLLHRCPGCLATLSNAPLCQFMLQVRMSKFFGASVAWQAFLTSCVHLYYQQTVLPCSNTVSQVTATIAGDLTAHLSALQLRSLCWSVILLPASPRANVSYHKVRLENLQSGSPLPRGQIGFPNTVTTAEAGGLGLAYVWHRASPCILYVSAAAGGLGLRS